MLLEKLFHQVWEKPGFVSLAIQMTQFRPYVYNGTQGQINSLSWWFLQRSTCYTVREFFSQKLQKSLTPLDSFLQSL
jgi:hypothetical protein